MPESRSRIDVPSDARDLPGDFAHRHEVEVRLSDTDAMGHVNNARYLTYVEIARVAYYEHVTGNALPIGAHGAEEGMILAVGPGAFDTDGKRTAMDVKVGQKVLYGKYAGTEFKLEGEELLIVSQKDILAVVAG